MVSIEHIYQPCSLFLSENPDSVVLHPQTASLVGPIPLLFQDSFHLSFKVCFKGHLFHETDKITEYLHWERHHCSEVGGKKKKDQKYNNSFQKFCRNRAQKCGAVASGKRNLWCWGKLWGFAMPLKFPLGHPETSFDVLMLW